ncbi:MAG: Asp-tRNA(Asn)/Glu-tRNA(Gln) amidotransferase subunit GatA, partial [Anaerolineales bacterium]
MTAPLPDRPAHEIAAEVRGGSLKAVQVLEAVLERMEKVEGRPPTLEPYELDPEDRKKVHAFITRTEARA